MKTYSYSPVFVNNVGSLVLLDETILLKCFCFYQELPFIPQGSML